MKRDYDICINLRDNYGNIEFYISENGMGVEDEERFINMMEQCGKLVVPPVIDSVIVAHFDYSGMRKRKVQN